MWWIANAGDGSGRLFLAVQGGQIRILDASGLRPTPFLDISALIASRSGEERAARCRVPPRLSRRTVFSRVLHEHTRKSHDRPFQGVGRPAVADPGSRTTILTIPHPTIENHNGGQLLFGPDGYLYIGTGDGGGSGDPNENGQNLNTLLGKILRIDVNGGGPYAIPPTNPFVGMPGRRPEIWAYGFRNPWRFTFDRSTGDLFIGDVGESQREEVDFQPAGAGGRNYGWDDFEGTLFHEPVTPGTGCGATTCRQPILEYNHDSGDCSITGGYRYRGAHIPGLSGRYLHGDYCTGVIRMGTEGGPGVWTQSALLDTAHNIITFGEDESGELYVSGQSTGVFKIVSSGPTALSVSDPQVTEGDGSSTTLSYTVSLSATVAQTVTATFGTAPGTATAGADYTTASGTVAFTPGSFARTVPVSVLGDLLDENNETVLLNLSSPSGATIADGQGIATILDNDPLPLLTVDDCSTPEGNAGTALCRFNAALNAPSGRTVSVGYATQSGTATSGPDFAAASGTLTFVPGAIADSIDVDVSGDSVVELNEEFTVALTSPTNVALVSNAATGVIVDDDETAQTGLGLYHGAEIRGTLAGGAPRLFFAPQSAVSSYEAILEDASGDAVPGLTLSRVASNGTTVLQAATSTGVGFRSLRWSNDLGVEIPNEYLRVANPSCGGGCGSDDRYRIRFYETTGALPRFNNSGGQTSVVILQNGGDAAVTGEVLFWNSAGALLSRQAFSIAGRGTFVLNTSTVPALQGLSGAATVTNNAPFGALRGKIVGIDPVGGFSFDAPMVFKPR